MTDYDRILKGLEDFSKTFGQYYDGRKWINFSFGNLTTRYLFDSNGYLLYFRAERAGTLHRLY